MIYVCARRTYVCIIGTRMRAGEKEGNFPSARAGYNSIVEFRREAKKKIGSLTETNVCKYYFVGFFLFLFIYYYYFFHSRVCTFSRYTTAVYIYIYTFFFLKLVRPGKKPHRSHTRTRSHTLHRYDARLYIIDSSAAVYVSPE